MAFDAPDFLRGKRVVVLGAGYIGGAVIDRARRAGAQVTALTRNPARGEAFQAAGVDVVIADLADLDAWGPRVPAADFVLNCVSSAGGGVEGYWHSYVKGGRAVLHWGQSTASRAALVYTSSTSVYPQDGGARVDETSPTPVGDERSAALLEAEQLMLRWPGPATVLRLAGIYGPGRHYLLDALRAGEATVAGQGQHHLNLIHRDDAEQAVLAAWQTPARAAGGMFNAADDGAATKEAVVTWLAERLQRPVPTFTGERAAGRRSVTPDRIILNTKLKQELRWTPRYPTYREGYEALLG